MSKILTYYALVDNDHILMDANTGQLEVYETFEHAETNGNGKQEITKVYVTKKDINPISEQLKVKKREIRAKEKIVSRDKKGLIGIEIEKRKSLGESYKSIQKDMKLSNYDFLSCRRVYSQFVNVLTWKIP